MALAPAGLAGSAAAIAAPSPEEPAIPDTFPTQPPALAREMVGASHANLKRVRELAEARPTLAKAAWDWGFGDWETALGAASHTGNREIAEYLLAHCAHPTIFSAAMLGQLEVVKAFVAAQPGVQRTGGPHGISLLAHAQAGGKASEPVLRYLEGLGDAGATAPAPLTTEEMNALAGNYSFGTGPNDRIEIKVVRGQLMFTRAETASRGLFHMGEHVFHPAGASTVRIRFAGSGTKTVLTVHDPELVLTGRRVGG